MHLWAVKCVVGPQASGCDSLHLYPTSLYFSGLLEMGVMDFTYGVVMSIDWVNIHDESD